MLNYIWFGLMAIALIFAALKGTADGVTKGAIDSAKTAVEISIGLIGVMSLWLGIMKIADRSGLVTLIARLIAPIMRLIFPEIPRDHPAMGAMLMNLAATFLGLNNAATPLGIKAMEELQTLNPHKDTATNSMVMFMALNTTGLQLIPATVIAILASAGAKNPTVVISTTLMATAIGMIAAVIVTKIVERFVPDPSADPGSEKAAPAEEVE